MPPPSPARHPPPPSRVGRRHRQPPSRWRAVAVAVAVAMVEVMAVVMASAAQAAAGTAPATAAPAASGTDACLWAIALVMLAALLVLGLRHRRLRRAWQAEQAARLTAEQAVMARGRFLGYLSHELRGTVGALSAGAQMLNQGACEPELRTQLLEGMRQSSAQLLELLEATLQHERSFHEGPLVLHPAPLPLDGWWRATLAPLHLAARAKGLTLRDSPPLPATLLIDGPRLAQVLNNLVHNAIKFTPQGEVQVSADWNGRRLLLRVADQGPGIAQAEQALVFQPYQQGAAASSQRQGAGLGLAICHQIVTAMGGRLWLDAPPGSPCIFSVDLPAPSLPSASPSVTQPRSEPLGLAA